MSPYSSFLVDGVGKITLKDGPSLGDLSSSPARSLLKHGIRDHCPCGECRHPETKQRLLDTFSIPEDISPKRVEGGEHGLRIAWANDEHESFYTWDWLRAQSKPTKPPTLNYRNVMDDDEGVKEWTGNIRQWGFCFVDGCPTTSIGTQSLIERIAFIRTTHYGGFWRFTSDLSTKDSAYTQLALGAHNDNTYFTDPAGLQTFHLLSHSNGDGGVSLLVDGFRAANILREESPEAFRTLCHTKIRGHSSGNENIAIMPDCAFPVITVENDADWRRAEVTQIRWNNDDRAAMTGLSSSAVAGFYAAARKWVAILRRPHSEYWVQLQPGTALTFDNWRVLHGRSAFTGEREMCGAYTNMDDFISRWKTLHFSKQDVLNAV
ncbi:MAG: hypothetical protein LQ339_000447 [Xanthoria mediterranea]|nr:MAG: hypothetical protein LQ339_000447 [Xanthoria mediterranea]